MEPVAVALDDTDLAKPTRIRVVVQEGRNREVRGLGRGAVDRQPVPLMLAWGRACCSVQVR